MPPPPAGITDSLKRGKKRNNLPRGGGKPPPYIGIDDITAYPIGILFLLLPVRSLPHILPGSFSIFRILFRCCQVSHLPARIQLASSF